MDLNTWFCELSELFSVIDQDIISLCNMNTVVKQTGNENKETHQFGFMVRFMALIQIYSASYAGAAGAFGEAQRVKGRHN